MKPIRVYRFLSEEHGLKAIQEGKLRVSRMRELNDPLDCYPVIVDEKGESVLTNEHPYMEGIHASIGVMCFSGGIEDPVIWSHYAREHRGMALEFEFENSMYLRKIKYPEDGLRPRIQLSDLDAAQKMDEDEDDYLDRIFEGFSYKAKSWAYEQEYRVFRFLRRCEMHGSEYFADMPFARLAAVILGMRSRLGLVDVRFALEQGKLVRPVITDSDDYNVRIHRACPDAKEFKVRLLQPGQMDKRM
jgi:hypothetical protein